LREQRRAHGEADGHQKRIEAERIAPRSAE
jgi:hypothetical protein